MTDADRDARIAALEAELEHRQREYRILSDDHAALEADRDAALAANRKLWAAQDEAIGFIISTRNSLSQWLIGH